MELAAIDPVLVQRAPLLDRVLGLAIPDTELTRSFDAELRKTSLEALLVGCLRARATAEPLVLVLEDCHWIDPVSRDLLESLVRASGSLPVLFLLAYRPASDPGGGLGLERLPHFSETRLDELEPGDAALLIRSKLEHLTGTGVEAPDALVDLVTTRSQGNPFYVEELLNYIQAHGVDIQDAAALASLELPGSLHSLILSRVDTIPEAPRRTLKVASVVGRSFVAPDLPGIYPELGSLGDIRSHLDELRGADLVTIDREDDESYIFKHVVTQEVAYESMPFAIRSDLHERVGGYIEETRPDAIERNLDLLAHHFWHSENTPKKREYLVRAGEAAQAGYANASAIDYFERAAPLLEGAERWQVTRRLGDVLEITGDGPARRPRIAVRCRWPRTWTTRRPSGGRIPHWQISRASAATTTRRPCGSMQRRVTSTSSETRSVKGGSCRSPGRSRRHAAISTRRASGSKQASRSGVSSATRLRWALCSPISA